MAARGGRLPEPVRHARRPPGRVRVVRVLTRMLVAVVVVVLAATGVAAIAVHHATADLHRSSIALPDPGPSAPQNILVMGLDSRLDENGNPLPRSVYLALHAGGSDDGGYNTNVLMLIHIPAGHGQAVGISIPRDDDVAFPGDPYGESSGKIKEAYGLELAQTLDHLVSTDPSLPHAQAYQEARAAARREEIATVSRFLGGVPIDHFIEVTMAAFYELAVAVQPITVCVDENTVDWYSGADFHRGDQQLDAKQAVAFVRQRRDVVHPGLDFTDLDRARRQQAFILSLLVKLGHENLLTNPGVLASLSSVAVKNVAVDTGFDPLRFATLLPHLAHGGLRFVTLPITGYATIDGADVNTVDTTAIRAETARLIAASDRSSVTAAASPHPHRSASGSPTAAPTPTPTRTDDSGPSDEAPISSGAIPCVK